MVLSQSDSPIEQLSRRDSIALHFALIVCLLNLILPCLSDEIEQFCVQRCIGKYFPTFNRYEEGILYPSSKHTLEAMTLSIGLGNIML